MLGVDLSREKRYYCNLHDEIYIYLLRYKFVVVLDFHRAVNIMNFSVVFLAILVKGTTYNNNIFVKTVLYIKIFYIEIAVSDLCDTRSL